ncbi:MAG: peptide chain release factor-like protein [Planctomycetota bacterium]|nr:peptide chain release factor-like protein [Planctomycetota bacterium]
MTTPPYALSDEALLASCERTAVQARGPGGQHVSRHACGIKLIHRASGVEAQCQDERDPTVNRSRALRRLRVRLAIAEPGQVDRSWWDQRRSGSRMPVTAQAKGYHLVAAVALAALQQVEGRLADAAASLQVSSSQLAAVLTADKEVHRAADAIRSANGHGVLRSR